MKVAVCLLVLVLVVTIEGLSDTHHRSKRGFRMGAADRFSHGFGKRADSLDSIGATGENILLSTEDLLELMQQNPKLAAAFVQRYLDVNGDGLISREELLESSRK